MTEQNIAPVTQLPVNTSSSIFLPSSFEEAQRMAKALSSSELVPKEYRGNIASSLIAMDMAARLQANVLMIMQNLYIVHGRPGWSSQFLIASFNKQRGFSPIRYEFKGEEKSDGWACRAYAMDLAADEKLEGTWITWAMAKAEGWVDKNGSKWKTMPEQMMRYRAAAFFIRSYAPDVSMGLYTQEELYDMPTIEGEVVSAEKEAKDIEDIIEGNQGQVVGAMVTEKGSETEVSQEQIKEGTVNYIDVIAKVKEAKDDTELYQVEMLIPDLPEDKREKVREEIKVRQAELAGD